MSLYDLKEESPPSTPKEEKTPLAYFKEFMNLEQTHRFLPYWSKMTRIPEQTLYFIKTEMKYIDNIKQTRLTDGRKD